MRTLHAAGIAAAYLLVFARSAGALAANDVPEVTDPPEVVVDFLMRLRDPDRTNSAPIQALLVQVNDHPTRYAQAFEAHLKLPERDSDLVDSGGGPVLRVGIAIFLTRELGKDVGGPLLIRFLDRVEARRAKADAAARVPGLGEAERKRAEAVRETLSHLMRGVIHEIGRFGDRSLIEKVFTDIERQDLPTQNAMLMYLGRVAPKDKAVAARLRAMVQDPGSTLHRNPVAHKILKYLESKRDATESEV